MIYKKFKSGDLVMLTMNCEEKEPAHEAGEVFVPVGGVIPFDSIVTRYAEHDVGIWIKKKEKN